MSDGPVPSRSRMLSDSFQILLVVGVLAIIGTAIYLRVNNSGEAPATPTAVQPTSTGTNTTPLPAAAGTPTTAQQRSDFVGQLAFKCDMNTGSDLCLLSPSMDTVELLDDASVYENAKAREPFSPDGNRMAFSQRSGDNQDIFVRHVHAGWIDQIVWESINEYQPAWSPDGQYLAYIAQEAEVASLWLYEFATRTSRQLTETTQANEQHPTWSPDGQKVAFWSDRDGMMQLYAIDVQTGIVEQIDTEGVAAWDPVWIKPAIERSPPETDETVLGLGITFDSLRCEADISVGDSGGMPTIERVQLQAGDRVVHSAEALETALYRATVDLGDETFTRELILQAWQQDTTTGEPVELRRTVSCTELALATETPVPTETPATGRTPTATFIVIEPPPQPANVFEAATMVARATEEARLFGTATPLPPNAVTATATPRAIVVTSTPTPANQATQVARNVLQTAIAATTGTPTPQLAPMITATPPPPDTPTTTATLTPTVTTTPVMIDIDELQRTSTVETAPTPTPEFPQQLVGRILFLSDMDGSVAAYAMTPDGSGIARLTNRWPYEYAAERDTYSDDRQYHVFVQPESARPSQIQLYYEDRQFDVVRQTTYFGTGRVWSPAWSPTDGRIAFVSNESGNDEIMILRKDEWPARRLTNNTWEWDHHPSWSPDGTQIVFASNRTGMRQIWIMNADGSDQRLLSPSSFEAWDPVWVKYEK